LQGQPIKIWDACTGHLRASYRAYDDADEITAAASVAFSPDGSKLVAGYNKALRVFDVSRPGRECRRISTYKKRQEGSVAGGWQNVCDLVWFCCSDLGSAVLLQVRLASQQTDGMLSE
jgi:WD40 repeat protein